MRFLVDECAGPAVAEWLRGQGHEVFSVFDEAQGMADADVLGKAFTENWILITNDKDFGEMVFRERREHHGVIFLRLAELVTETKILQGKDRDLTKLVLKNLYPEKDFRATLVGFNKTNHTAIIGVVAGNVFTEGCHVSIRKEGAGWRLISNNLIWQHNVTEPENKRLCNSLC